MTSSHQVIEEGRLATQLLEDTLLSGVFALAREGAISEWAKSDDPREREQCWHRVHAVDSIIQDLSRLVDRGEQEEKKLAKS